MLSGRFIAQNKKLRIMQKLSEIRIATQRRGDDVFLDLSIEGEDRDLFAALLMAAHKNIVIKECMEAVVEFFVDPNSPNLHLEPVPPGDPAEGGPTNH